MHAFIFRLVQYFWEALVRIVTYIKISFFEGQATIKNLNKNHGVRQVDQDYWTTFNKAVLHEEIFAATCNAICDVYCRVEVCIGSDWTFIIRQLTNV